MRAPRSVWSLCAGLLAAAAATAAAAQEVLPLPRFVSLRAPEVNMRIGPGVDYPIDWVFVRSGLPLEVVAEFEHWRRVRDAEGVEGWVHKSMLSGKRTVLVVGGEQTLREEPQPDATAVAVVQPGVVGALEACAGEWCRIEAGDYAGWLPRAALWGVYPDETIE